MKFIYLSKNKTFYVSYVTVRPSTHFYRIANIGCVMPDAFFQVIINPVAWVDILQFFLCLSLPHYNLSLTDST